MTTPESSDGLRPLRSFRLPETLPLPISDTYTLVVPEPDAATAVLIQRLYSAAMVARAGGDPTSIVTDLNDNGETDLYRRIFRDEWDQLQIECTWPEIKHCFQVVIIWVVHGLGAAKTLWEHSSGEAKAPTRRPGTPATGPSAAATSTQKRDYSSGTRSRRTRRPARRGKR